MISSLIGRARFALRRISFRRPKYRIGKFEIQLTRDHSLPEYQHRFPTYDRFLPKLCRDLPSGSVVVDVGANVGDTIAAIASENHDLRFIAVEPDPEFCALLAQNVERMRKVVPQLDVEIVRAFIGDNLKVVSSEGGRGTRRAIVSDDDTSEPSSIRLDDVLGDKKIGSTTLVKVDTDGFDWSVLNSGIKLIQKIRPLLFFECDTSNDISHINKYIYLIEMLSKLEYTKFYVFDNFGGLIGLFEDVDDVLKLLKYVDRQNKGVLARTIYYVDILAITSEDVNLVENAI